MNDVIEKHDFSNTVLTGIQVHFTGDDKPALWENGGGRTNTGTVQVICGQKGQKLQASVIKRESNGDHALIPIQPDDYIIQLHRHHDEYEITVSHIIEIYPDIVVIHEDYSFKIGGWNRQPPEFLKPAIETAIEKSNIYHCREAMYCGKPKKII